MNIKSSKITKNLYSGLNRGNQETFWLEEQHFQIAKHLSDTINNSEERWQNYLNSLAFLGVKESLQQRKPELEINRQKQSSIGNAICNLTLGKFKLCIITLQDLFGTIVNLPKDVFQDPDYAAHFYIPVEVIEEQQHIVIHGFLRYDQLKETIQENQIKVQEKERSYSLPLSLFESDLDRLLIYLRFLTPNAIPLPISIQERIGVTHLSNWLNNIVESGWETWESLQESISLSPSYQLTTLTRSGEFLGSNSFKNTRIKLLGTEIENLKQPIGLFVSLIPTNSSELEIVLSLKPLEKISSTIQDLQMLLLNDKGEILIETKAKTTETMQITFRGELGDRFQIKVIVGNISFTEQFLI